MGLSLADILPSAAAALGVAGFENRFALPPTRHAVVCLIDGLGWHTIAAEPETFPFLSTKLTTDPIASAFPTTTPVGLASLGTGLLAGMHGFVGASFLLPETGHILSPLQWGGDPVPLAVQPEATVFEKARATGISVVTAAPGTYRHSGLTRAALRGADYRACEGIEERVAAVRSILATGARSLTYVYWADVDRTGHEFGLGSPQWRTAASIADELVARLASELVSGSVMVVTSDHGMVNCPDSHHISIETTPGLRDGVLHIAGEPRLRHVYARTGAVDEVLATWKSVLSDRMTVLSRDELIESGALGPVDVGIAERVGDVVAIAEGHWMLTSHSDARVSSLLGQHGSWTPQEMDIPAMVMQGGA